MICWTLHNFIRNPFLLGYGDGDGSGYGNSKGNDSGYGYGRGYGYIWKDNLYERIIYMKNLEEKTKEHICKEFIKVCKNGTSKDCSKFMYEAKRNGISYEELCDYKRKKRWDDV